MTKLKSLNTTKRLSDVIKDSTILIKKIKHYFRYFFTFLLITVLLIIGDIIIVYSSEIYSFPFINLSPIFTLLITINISLFVLSITIYALILKLTEGKVIGRYIQNDLEINRICIIFISFFFLIVINYVLLFSLNVFINLISEIFFIMSLILSMLFILRNIIFRILPATTLDRSLDFFTNKLTLLKKEFSKYFHKINKKELKKIERSKKENKDFPKFIGSFNFKRYLTFDITKKFLNKYMNDYSKYHRDAMNLLIEIQERTKSSESDLYIRIGKAVAPPYINYDDFITNNLIIPLKEIYEKYPKFSNCYLDYLEGYITEMFNSEFFDDTMLANVERILPYIQEIGFKNESSTSSNLLFDKTNDILYRITKLISEYKIDEQNLYSTNIRDRVIKRIAIIIKENKRGIRPKPEINLILLNETLGRLRNLIKLNLSFGNRKYIIDKIMEIISIFSRNPKGYYYDFYFFSIFQDIWEEIITENNIINSQRYIQSFITYINEIVRKFTNMAYTSTIKSFESNEFINDYPFLRQINRIFVNLAYQLKIIYNSTKNDLIQNTIINIFQNTYHQLVDLGNKFEQNSHRIDIRYYIGCPIIVGSLLFAEPIIKNGLNNIKETLSEDFGIFCLFGIKLVINEFFECKQAFDNKYDNLIYEKIELIKNFFLKPTIQLEEYMKNQEGLPSMWVEKHEEKFGGSIESRPGSEKKFPFGYYIGSLILHILNFISNQEIIVKFIKKHYNERAH